MAEFGKCSKSLQTPWNSSYMLENGFATACGIIRVDFGWIRKGPKSADFWANSVGYSPSFWRWRILVSAGTTGHLLWLQWIFSKVTLENDRSRSIPLRAVAHRFGDGGSACEPSVFVQCDIICSIVTLRARGGLGTWPWCLLPCPAERECPREMPEPVIGWICTSPHGNDRWCICNFGPEADGLKCFDCRFSQ